MKERTILDEERDNAYAHWRKLWESMSPSDLEDAGEPTTMETWCAAWEYAMDIATKCVQLMDAGYKDGPIN